VQALIAGLPTSFSDPRQQVVYELLNRRIEKYSSIIRDVALNERVGYVPVYEEIAAKIRALPGRAFTFFRFLPFYRDAFRLIILHKSPDEVSHDEWLELSYGWRPSQQSRRNHSGRPCAGIS
jgi:hypothetical protein